MGLADQSTGRESRPPAANVQECAAVRRDGADGQVAGQSLQSNVANTGCDAIRNDNFGVEICTSAIFSICDVTSIDAPRGTCITCNFGAGTFDFNNYIYYVTVKVYRATTDVDVRANTLRIY